MCLLGVNVPALTSGATSRHRLHVFARISCLKPRSNGPLIGDMPASAQSSADATASERATVGPVTGAPDGELPKVGQPWRSKYEIIEQLAADSTQAIWRGRAIEGGEDVVLRGFAAAEPEVRAQVWAKLGGIDSPHLQRAREGFRVGSWRVEVSSAVRGVALSAWRRERASVDADTVKAIVAQVAEALGALHAFEQVHLGLRPDVIFIEENGSSLRCTLAGLDSVTAFDRAEMVRIAVDPLYAPPEAAGLQLHNPGPGLCAWDWWSLGRVAQELVIGKTVVQHLNPSIAEPAALRAAAEVLLAEADANGPRAGAVERMNALDPNLQLMLRGLLTSAAESRWTGDNVDRWVRGLPVKEFYATPRKDTHLKWRGRPYTVPELAAALQTSENWGENNVQLFEATTPGTLAHSLKWSPSHSAALEQLSSALELADSLPLKLSSPAAQREAVTMVALLQLSGGKLVWRGQEFGAAAVATMMNELGEADAVMILRALSTRATAMQIERIDNVAGRLLTEIGRTAGDVESTMKRYSWLATNDVVGAARIFRLSVEPLGNLRTTRDELLKRFAGSDHAAMAKILKAQNVGRTELVLLAWAAAAPDGFKFFSHDEAARRRADSLRTRGAELVATLSWTTMEEALNFGRIVFGDWSWFLLTWFVVGAGYASLWPGPIGLAIAVAPAIAALLTRVALTGRQRTALRQVHQEAAWAWHDGPARCRREFRLAGAGVRRQVLEEELASVQKELKELDRISPTPNLPEVPQFKTVRVSGFAAWALLGAGIAVLGWREYQQPFAPTALRQAWSPQAPAKKPEKTVVVAAKPEEKDEDVKVSWPYRSTGDATKVTLQSTVPATKAQVEYATQHGRDLVKPYRPETISNAIIMPVPAADPDQAAVMFFDGKRGELSSQQVFILGYRPIPRTLISIDGHKGVYLDR